MDFITLGEYVPGLDSEATVEIVCDDPALEPHVTRPYFMAHIERQIGMSVASHVAPARRKVAGVDANIRGRHWLVLGKTGAGKSRAIDRIFEQHLKLGASIVRIEPKFEAVMADVARARAMGLRPEQVVVASPRLECIPGWNTFRTEIPLLLVVNDITDIFMRLAGSPGPRMTNVCQNLLILIGVHKTLSIVEGVRALQRPDFLERLVRTPPPPGTSAADRLAHAEASEFFAGEFQRWSKGEQAAAAAPILTRFAEVVRVHFLFAHLCAEKNDIDLPSLWRKQTVLLFHLDFAVLGETGAKILAGLVSSMLLRTAMRSSGPVPVLLIADEVSIAQKYSGDALSGILAVARSQGLSVLLGSQFLHQMAEDLRRAALSQTSVRLFFRLEHEDAQYVARALAAGSESRVRRVEVRAGNRRQDLAQWRHVITDSHGRKVRINDTAWKRFVRDDLFEPDPVRHLYRLAAASGVTRLYVRCPTTGRAREIRTYVVGMPSDAVTITGPAPLELVMCFPRPSVSADIVSEADHSKAWANALQRLPHRHAVLEADGMLAGVIRLADVKDAVFGPVEKVFLDAVLSVNAQSPAQIQMLISRRRNSTQSDAPQSSKERTDDSIF